MSAFRSLVHDFRLLSAAAAVSHVYGHEALLKRRQCRPSLCVVSLNCQARVPDHKNSPHTSLAANFAVKSSLGEVVLGCNGHLYWPPIHQHRQYLEAERRRSHLPQDGGQLAKNMAARASVLPRASTLFLFLAAASAFVQPGTAADACYSGLYANPRGAQQVCFAERKWRNRLV